MLNRALKFARLPILLSFVVTPLRFFLEMQGIPDKYIFLIGLLWLTLAFAIYWATQLVKKEKAYATLLLSLLISAPISRLSVVLAWWVDKRWHIGSHYGDFFDTWPSVLLNQVVYGALVQIIPGFVVGGIVLAVLNQRHKS